MSCILTLRPAVRGGDGVPVLDVDAPAEALLTKTVALRVDQTVAWSKQEVADAVGFCATEENEPFECEFPMFKQFVKVSETYDHYLIKPRKGWKKQPTLCFFTEIRKCGETKLVVGTYEVDLTRDAEGVAIIADKCSCPIARLMRAKLPRFGCSFSRCKKGANAPTQSGTKGEPLLIGDIVIAK